MQLFLFLWGVFFFQITIEGETNVIDVSMIVNKRKLSILGHTTEQSMHILTCKQVTADIKTHGFDRT